MGTLRDSVRELAIELVDFQNDTLEQLIEDQNVAYGDMSEAAAKFEQVSEGAENNPLPGAQALVKLAGKFGLQKPDISPDGTEEVKTLIAQIYEDPNAEVETAGENLFNTSLDFIVKTQALNAYVASQVAGGE